MKWFKYNENGVKQYAPQLVKENGHYIKPSFALLESLGYQSEPDEIEQQVIQEGVFSHGEPYFVENDPLSIILSGLQRLDNSIVVQAVNEDNVAEDVSFIQCFYGHQRSHVEAAKKALLMNLKSKPKFGEWIFVEAQVDNEREFEWLKDRDIKYEFVKIPDESKWMFLKWPLWNFGIKKASFGKFAFADADIVFCNAGWAARISDALEKFDIVSLSEKCYYAEQSFKDKDAKLNSHKGLLDTAGAVVNGHAGFTFGFTERFLSEFKRFNCSIQKHGDVKSWKRAREMAKNKGLKVGCAEGVCCHVSHGFISDRWYEESKDVFREIGEDPDSFVVYGPADVLPRWNSENPRCAGAKRRFEFLYFDQFCPKGKPIVLDKSLSLGEVRSAVQKKIDDSVEDGTNFVKPIIQGADPENVDDVAVVECLFGTNAEQVAAAKKAIDLLVASRQRPAEWIFVEAQRGEELAQMKEFCGERGIRYVFMKVSRRSDGVFIKNALWTAGARLTAAPKLVFVDSDVAFSNAHWLEKTSEELDGFKVVQPFSEIWMSEELASSDGLSYFPAAFRQSFAYALKNGKRADVRRHVPGYALAMTRAFFDEIGGLDVLPSNGSDAWFWLRHLPPEAVLKSSAELPLTGEDYGWSVSPDGVSYAGNMAFHIRHGTRSGRKYHETLYFNQKFCSRVNETLEMDSETGLPAFKDEPRAKAHQACVLRCRRGDEDPETVFAEEKFKVYDRVSEKNKVVFLTVLNNDSGREVMSHSVVRMHKFLIDKYCMDPHEYWCLTNDKIDGIDSIPFELDVNREIIGWNAQYELFRNLFPGRPVMTLDFDCVPTRPFVLHDPPDGYFSMMYETCNLPESLPNVMFNLGTSFFKGDFSYVFEEYKDMLRRKIPPSMYFTTVQDFVAYSILSHGAKVENVLNVADVFLVKLDHPAYKPVYGQIKNHTFVHYLGKIKPWNTKVLKKLGLRYAVPGEFTALDEDF